MPVGFLGAMKIDARLTFCLYCFFAALTVLAFPWALSDQNDFLEQFMTHEFLSFMGVVVTITLASTANIHISLRRKEESIGDDTAFSGTRARVKASAFSLIWAMFLSLALVVIKPLLPSNIYLEAAANATGIAIILWGILIILDITKLSFKL
jgi:hypothetical protein